MRINKEGKDVLSKEIQEILFGEGKKKADICLVWSLGLEENQAGGQDKQKKKSAFELLSGNEMKRKVIFKDV